LEWELDLVPVPVLGKVWVHQGNDVYMNQRKHCTPPHYQPGTLLHMHHTSHQDSPKMVLAQELEPVLALVSGTVWVHQGNDVHRNQRKQCTPPDHQPDTVPHRHRRSHPDSQMMALAQELETALAPVLAQALAQALAWGVASVHHTCVVLDPAPQFLKLPSWR